MNVYLNPAMLEDTAGGNKAEVENVNKSKQLRLKSYFDTHKKLKNFPLTSLNHIYIDGEFILHLFLFL